MTKAPATARGPLREAWSSCLVMTLVLVLNLTVPARAHDHHGPPLQIITDQRVGPYLVSVWAHPMVGTGTFFVAVKSPSGNTVPDDLKVEIGIQPVSGRLPGKNYLAQREALSDQAQYQAEAAFDAQEIWRVRIRVQGAQGGGEAVALVEATPMGPARWALLLYLVPFVCVGFLWLGVMVRRRGVGKEQLATGN